jgi:hypothetical protein
MPTPGEEVAGAEDDVASARLGLVAPCDRVTGLEAGDPECRLGDAGEVGLSVGRRPRGEPDGRSRGAEHDQPVVPLVMGKDDGRIGEHSLPLDPAARREDGLDDVPIASTLEREPAGAHERRLEPDVALDGERNCDDRSVAAFDAAVRTADRHAGLILLDQRDSRGGDHTPVEQLVEPRRQRPRPPVEPGLERPARARGVLRSEGEKRNLVNRDARGADRVPGLGDRKKMPRRAPLSQPAGERLAVECSCVLELLRVAGIDPSLERPDLLVERLEEGEVVGAERRHACRISSADEPAHAPAQPGVGSVEGDTRLAGEPDQRAMRVVENL